MADFDESSLTIVPVTRELRDGVGALEWDQEGSV